VIVQVQETKRATGHVESGKVLKKVICHTK